MVGIFFDVFIQRLGFASGLRRHMGARNNFQKVEITFLILGNQHKAIGHRFAHDFANSRLIAKPLKTHLHAKDRLNTRTTHGASEIKRAEHIVGIGHRNGRLAVSCTKLGKLLRRDGTFGKRIVGVNTKMDETVFHRNFTPEKKTKDWSRGVSHNGQTPRSISLENFEPLRKVA